MLSLTPRPALSHMLLEGRLGSIELGQGSLKAYDGAVQPGSRDVAIGVAGAVAIAAVIAVLRTLQSAPNPTIAALLLLLVILVTATAVRVGIAMTVSVVATLAFNFFLLPPFYTFTLADPQNWVALFVFLVVAIIASQLSAAVRARAHEAVGRRDELARLFDLSRDVLVITDSHEAISILARSIARRFDLEFVALALPRDRGWAVFEGGARTLSVDTRELSAAFAAAQASLEFNAHAGTYAGHRTVTIENLTVRLVPLRVGTKPTGILAAGGRPVEPGTLDTLAGVVAIAIERADFLEERNQAELTRQSEALKATLLTSLAHDLRTPLTAIRVAATNVKAPWLTDDDRLEQSDLILAEAERLTRLFQNILEMARIAAGPIATESRLVHPSEIIAAARSQVEQTLQAHPLDVHIDADVPVRVDPRLTATAVAHLLENAAQYAPAGTGIDVTAGVSNDELRITVRDHGPGIDPVDLPHLFERFYRGAAAKTRASGTGMGLWIARGLLAAEHGHVWADNCPDGGATFTVAIPALQKNAAPTTIPVR
jgi:two-component system sensor histidine kinase KdpD